MNLSDSKAASTSGVWKAADVAPDQFPAGLRVLVVDDDPTCLRILEKMLLACFYKVTKCNRAEIALSLLRQERNGFDVVISDVHMPDMDGFKLLEHIGLEMDLPVIMMSADDGKDVVYKGVTHGACDYLIKPVRIEALKNIWQHVVRKRKNEWKDLEQSGSVEDGDKQVKPCEDADNASSANEGSWRNPKKRKDEEDDLEDRDDSSTLKKPRVVWSVELHQQFVAAVHQLGIDKAVPKKILEMMNVPGLTRENVASHLQKYRLYLRRVSGVSQHQNGFSNSFMTSPEEATFGQMSSLNGLDFQTLAASGQLQAQSLATLQASALGNQRNIFSFENPKLRFEQQQQQTNNSSKPVNLLHGIPTAMEVKQLSNFHPSSQSFGGMNMQQSNPLMMQIAHVQSRRAQPNDSTSTQLSSPGQPKLSNGLVENGKRPGIITVSEASSLISFPNNQTSELSGISFPLGSSPGMSNLTSKGVFQKDVNSNMKQQNGCAPSYGIFNEHNQQNLGFTFGSASQHLNSVTGNLDVLPSVIVHQQGFSSSLKLGNNGNIGNAMFLTGESSGHRNVVENIDHQHHPNTLVFESARKVKTEGNQDSNFQSTTFYREQHFGQEDLMSVLLKQQESIVPVEAEFDFDGYSLDNIPV